MASEASFVASLDFEQVCALFTHAERKKGEFYGRRRCNWCKETMSSNITKLHQHLTKCRCYSRENVAKYKQIAVSAQMGQIADKKRQLNRLAAPAIFLGGRPFNLFEGPGMRESFTLACPSWRPRNGDQVAILLPEVYLQEYSRVKQILDMNLFDGSDDITNHRLCNVAIQLPGSVALYWHTLDTGSQTHTAESSIEILKPIFDEITNSTPNRINSIVTVTNSTMRKIHKQVSASQSSGWESYAISSVRSTRKRGSFITFVITRWGTQLRAVASILRSKEALQRFVCNPRNVSAAYTDFYGR